MRAWLVLGLVAGVTMEGVAALARHACQSDADCARYGSSSYAFECCTTVVCNARYNYFLVSSGCVAAPNPFRKCGKLAQPSSTGRYAAQLRYEKWQGVEAQVGENCDAARLEVSRALGAEPPPAPVLPVRKPFSVPVNNRIPIKKDLLQPPSDAGTFRRNFPSRNSFYRTTTTKAPRIHDPSVKKLCAADSWLRKRCEGTGAACCIKIKCEMNTSLFRRVKHTMTVKQECYSPDECGLQKLETRTNRGRMYLFTFPPDLWEENWFDYLDENFNTSPLTDCSELRYFFYHLENEEKK